MQVYKPFHFDSRHWLLALVIALLVHTTFFLSYKSNKYLSAEKVAQKSLVIQLKKITRPPQVKPFTIQQPKVDPLPEFKPEPIPKPKPIIKPKIQPKPKVDVVSQPVEIPQKNIVEEPVEPDQTLIEDSVSVPNESDTVQIDPALKRRYELRLLAWLEKHKKYPIIARRRGQQGTVMVEFTMNAGGEVLSHTIVQASKYAALNEAVVKMIRRSSPMPAVPKELRGFKTQYSYTIPINFTLK